MYRGRNNHHNTHNAAPVYNPSAPLGESEEQENEPLDEHFILRVPPRVAEKIRAMLRSKERDEIKGLDFLFNDFRYGSVKVAGESFEGVVLDLPCIIEVQKTLDNVNYYKSADIGQMFFIRDKKEDNNPHIPYIDYEEFRFNSGITPPTRNIRKRKFRKPYTDEQKQEIGQAENEILRLIKGSQEDEDIEVMDENALEKQESNDGFYDASPVKAPPSKPPQTQEKTKIRIPKIFASGMTPTPVTPTTPASAITTPQVSVGEIIVAPDDSGKRKKKKEKKEKKKDKKDKKDKKERKKKKKKTETPSTTATPATATAEDDEEEEVVVEGGEGNIALTLNTPLGASATPQFSPSAYSLASPVGFSPNAFTQLSPQFLAATSPSQVSPSPMEMTEFSTVSPTGFTNEQLSPVQSEASLISPVSYKEDPQYLNLKQEEISLQREIVNVNKKIADTQQQLKAALNPIQQSRFQKKIDEFNALLRDKESKLKQVQADIAKRES